MKYQCNKDSADGTVQANTPTEVKLKAKGDPVAGPEFPVGTKCEVVDEDLNEPKFEGYSFTGYFGREVTVTDDAEASTLEVINYFTKDGPTGSLLIKPSVQGVPLTSLPGSVAEWTTIIRCGPASQPPHEYREEWVRIPLDGTVYEFEGVPVGYECLVAQGGFSLDGYTNEVVHSPADPEGGKVTIKEGQGENDSNLVTITHKYEPDTAPKPIFVKKVIAGERPASLNDDTEFTVKYQCDKDSTDGKVTADTPTEVKLKAKGDPVTGPEFPVGTKCKVVEEKPDEPKFEGYSFTGDLGGEITVTGDTAARTMVVTNTFKKDGGNGSTGSLLIKKKVQGLDDLTLIGDTILVHYVCVPAGQPVEDAAWKFEWVPVNGDLEEIQNIPVGYECHVKEKAEDAKVDGYTPDINYSPAGPEGGKVTIKEGQGENDSNLVTITNTYKPDAAPQSIFVKKVIAGERPASLNDDTEFTVKYQCDKDSTDGKVTANTPTEVKLKAKGDPVTGPEFPTGTKCKVVEEKPDAPKFEGYSFTGDLGGEITVTGDTAARTMVVTNTFKKDGGNGSTGTLEVSKDVRGIKADSKLLKDHEFEAAYKCVKNDKTTNEGTIKVKAGETVTVDNIVVNSVCTVTENLDSTKVSGLRFLPELSTTKVTAEKITVDGGSTKAKLLNAYGDLDAPINSGDSSWWWALIPLAILSSGGSSGSTSSPGTNPTTAQPTTPQDGAQAKHDASKSTNAPASLARTGASVLGVVALAGIAIAAGIFLVRRGRNKN